jgi:hypothetical protein
MMLISDILDRVSQQIGAKSNADIGRALGIQKNPSQYVKNWRERGTIPWEELCTFAIKQKISLDWLFTGGEKQHADSINVKKIDEIESYNYLREIFDSEDIETHRAIKQNLKQFALLAKTYTPYDNVKKAAGPSSAAKRGSRKRGKAA